jgi:hypothetical protein
LYEENAEQLRARRAYSLLFNAIIGYGIVQQAVPVEAIYHISHS